MFFLYLPFISLTQNKYGQLSHTLLPRKLGFHIQIFDVYTVISACYRDGEMSLRVQLG